MSVSLISRSKFYQLERKTIFLLHICVICMPGQRTGTFVIGTSSHFDLTVEELKLFHTYWDLHCEVPSLVSLIGRKMCFHSRSLPIFDWFRLVRNNLSLYNIKTSHNGKCWNNFHSLVALRCIKKRTRGSLKHRNERIKKLFERTFQGRTSILSTLYEYVRASFKITGQEPFSSPEPLGLTYRHEFLRARDLKKRGTRTLGTRMDVSG